MDRTQSVLIFPPTSVQEQMVKGGGDHFISAFRVITGQDGCTFC